MEIIKNVEPVKFYPFSKEPISSNTLVYVYKNAKGKYRIVKDGNQLSLLELWSGRYTLRYTVSTQAIEYKHEREYHSKDLGKCFNVILQMTILVKDPEAVVRNEIHDLESYLEMNLPYCIQPLVEEYGIEDVKKVRNLMRQVVQDSEIQSDLEIKGFMIDKVLAHVGLSHEDWQHLKRVEELKRKQELTRIQIQNEREIQKWKQEWALEDEKIKSRQKLLDITLKEFENRKSLYKELLDKVIKSLDPKNIDDMDIRTTEIFNNVMKYLMVDPTKPAHQPDHQERDKKEPNWDRIEELFTGTEKKSEEKLHQ